MNGQPRILEACRLETRQQVNRPQAAFQSKVRSFSACVVANVTIIILACTNRSVRSMRAAALNQVL